MGIWVARATSRKPTHRPGSWREHRNGDPPRLLRITVARIHIIIRHVCVRGGGVTVTMRNNPLSGRFGYPSA